MRLKTSVMFKLYCTKLCHHVGCLELRVLPGGVLQKGFLKNFANFTGKCLCQSLFFNKVAGFPYFLD